MSSMILSVFSDRCLIIECSEILDLQTNHSRQGEVTVSCVAESQPSQPVTMGTEYLPHGIWHTPKADEHLLDQSNLMLLPSIMRLHS